MKEFYINKKGQKRRLRFSVGDIILCEHEDELVPYIIVQNSNDKTKYDLMCLLCTEYKTTEGFSEKELQQLLYGFNPYDVITKKTIKDFLSSTHPEKKISNC